jgi:hypothetical protein
VRSPAEGLRTLDIQGEIKGFAEAALFVANSAAGSHAGTIVLQ